MPRPERSFTSVKSPQKKDIQNQSYTGPTNNQSFLIQELMPLDGKLIKTQLSNKIGYMLKQEYKIKTPEQKNILNLANTQYSWSKRSSSNKLNQSRNNDFTKLNDFFPNQIALSVKHKDNRKILSLSQDPLFNESTRDGGISTRPDTSFYLSNASNKHTKQESKLTNQSLKEGYQCISQIQTDNIDALMRSKYDSYFQNMIRLSSKAVDNNDLELLEFFLINIAESMMAVKQIDKATFFYNQLRIFYTYTSNHVGKCKALQGLAECCTYLHQSHSSIKILKRALQYSWFTGDLDSELNIYEKLALSYFYVGAIEKSSYFHSRSLLGGVEQADSPVKFLSMERINEYIKNISFTFTDITTLLLTYMSIPLQSMEQYPTEHKHHLPNYVNGVSPRATNDISKSTTYLRSKAYDLIDHIQISDEEFRESIPTPRFSGRVSFNFVNVKVDIPVKVRMNRHHFIPSYYSKYKENDYNEKWSDSTLYKLPLKKRIEMRIKAPPKIEDISAKLLEGIKKSKLNDLEVLRSPINLNHWMKEQQVYNRDRNTKTFRSILERILKKNIQTCLK